MKIYIFRSHAIEAKVKLYSTLQFYATGTFLQTIGDLSGISVASMSRIVNETSKAIASLSRNYIFMPRNQQELQNNFTGFYTMSKFPTAVGAIDCTHVKIFSS